jgi:hypothetical protein
MTDKLDAILAQEEQLLKVSTAKAMQAYQQDNSTDNLRKWQAAKKALAEFTASQGESGDRFKNLAEVARWVITQGYLVSERSIHNHARYPGFPHKQKDGGYVKHQVETYAASVWENPSRPAAPASTDSANDKARMLKEQADKLELANEITRKNYILRSLVEQEMAARASFLKRDLYNLGPRLVDRVVEQAATLIREAGVDLTGVNMHQLIPDIEQFYAREIGRHLNNYAEARGFIPVGEND